MRILMWVSFYWPEIGGVETITRQLAHALKANGHTVCVVAGHGNAELPDVADDNGIAVHRFRFRDAIEQRDPMRILDVQKRIDRLKTEFAPDLLHLNCIDPSIFFYLRSINVHPAPTVLTLHWTPDSDQWAAHTILGKVLRSVTWLIAISEYQIPLVNTLLPEMTGHASLLVNGLVTPTLVPAPYPDTQRILCIGRIVGEKGFDIAIDAFALIARDFPLARLIIAGNGPERPALIERAQQRRIGDRTEFTGWVDHDAVPQLMNESAMVVMPSRFEPFGLVAVEAGQMARPAIVTRIGGLIDIVIDGETGLIVAPDDSAELATAMARLLRNPIEAKQMGAVAQQRASALFTGERNTRQYEELFTALVTEHTDAS